jgi:hypothetical protein
MQTNEEFPSGKTITRDFDDNGRLSSEMHMHGMLDVCLQRSYSADGSIDEMYFVKRRLVSRARYEKARADYPEMPAADAGLQDLSGELVKGAAREQRERSKAAKQHVADEARAAEIDSFCTSLMERGQRKEAAAWLESRKNTLGELSSAASCRLVAKLSKLGCGQVYACEIDQSVDGGNSGHLVVELPSDAELRRGVFKELGRLAAKQGLTGDLEDGQRYSYIKLD